MVLYSEAGEDGRRAGQHGEGEFATKTCNSGPTITLTFTRCLVAW
jgi:hypothetical protein